MGRFSRWVVARIRRSRLLPTGVLNRVADSARLGQAVDASVVVWFPTALDSLYQLRPWYDALRELHATHRLVIVCRDSRVAKAIRQESSLDALSLSTSAELDAILADSTVKVALYVNLDPLDFDCLRFRSLAHVYIGHGDSDKAVFASNQIKAFDRYFVAGSAAVARLGTQLMFFDAAARTAIIGQPQLDGAALSPSALAPAAPTGSPPRVVYAPTWEGAHPSASYSSVVSHGEHIVGSLIAAGFTVVYRPHPFTGREDATYRQVDERLRKIVAAGGQLVDESPDLRAAFDSSDVLITDVSAVVSYWLPSGRPILLTEPVNVALPADTLSARLPRLSVAEAPSAAAGVTALLADPPDLSAEIATHLGDVTPGAATAAFVVAVGQMIADRDTAWATVDHAGGA